MMKNYKLLLLAALSIAVPVYAMEQDEESGQSIMQNWVDRFGAETAARIARAAQRAADQEQQAEQAGAAAPVIEMIPCARCQESHKRPQQVSLGRYVNIIEMHPCFTIPFQNGEIEPVIVFVPVD